MIFPRSLSSLRRWSAGALVAGLAFAPALAAKTGAAKPADAGATYKGAIVMDAATGNVLFADHENEVGPPASMTKLMTFAVVYDKLQSGQLTLQTPITVMAPETRMGGTQVWLKENEVFTVEELLYAVMIQSANDAAYALARTAGGTIPIFVGMMNAKAHELGMTQTTFRTPHGLPPSNRRVAEGDLTTPHDFALLCRYLVLKTDVTKFTSVKRRRFGPPSRDTMMDNHDHLLGRVRGVDGLKTGFTNGAAFCLSATALRNNHRIIVVVMGSPNAKIRDLKVADLIEQGFAGLPPDSPAFATAIEKRDPAGEASPISAAPLPSDEVNISAVEDPAAIKFSLPPPPKKKK